MSVQHDELEQFMALALRLATANLHDLYLRAKPTVRRFMNQAIFEAIWVETDEESSASWLRSQLASPFAEMRTLANELAESEGSRQTKAPDSWAESKALVVGSITDEVVAQYGTPLEHESAASQTELPASLLSRRRRRGNIVATLRSSECPMRPENRKKRTIWKLADAYGALERG
jgi:hypothetical protein